MNRRSLTTPLTEDDASRFAAARMSRSECPRCGFNDWSFADESSTGEIAGLTTIDGKGLPSGMFATIVYTCDNCGFISAHAKKTVVNWLNGDER